jgi:Uma2 family endonuclease
MPPPISFHGLVCARFVSILAGFVEQHSLGLVLSNDSGVITERDPDTVRGADVCYYSKAKIHGDLPRDRYLDVVPDLVVEVRSPTDRWQKVLAKVSEYLTAGVIVVVVADPATDSALVYRDEGLPQTFGPNDTLTIPDLLPGFGVPVARLYR